MPILILKTYPFNNNKNSIMGPIRARLEPTSPRLPPAPRVPRVHLVVARGPADGDADDVLPVRLRARAADVVHLQEAARLPARAADVPAAPRPPRPHPLAARPEGPR